MIYVGIDVAKETHYAAVSDDSSKVLVKPFAFENTAEGFCLLLSKISEFPKEDVLIGLESTGIYSENLICFLYEAGYKLAVINPIQTATLRKTRLTRCLSSNRSWLILIAFIPNATLNLSNLKRFVVSDKILKNPRLV